MRTSAEGINDHCNGAGDHINSGLAVLLGAIIKNTKALYANQFAELHLFGPFGIEIYEWEVLGNGTIQTGIYCQQYIKR